MINVARVIHSRRLGCQRITVHRTTAGWVNGEFIKAEAEDVVSPVPSEMAAVTDYVITPEPADLETADILVGITPDVMCDLTFDAIVTVASPKDLQLVPEADRKVGSMRFLTTRRLYQTNDATISDIVLWRGAKYKVLTLTPDIDYGFYRSVGVRLEGDSIG